MMNIAVCTLIINVYSKTKNSAKSLKKRILFGILVGIRIVFETNFSESPASVCPVRCTFCDGDLISLWLEADPGDLEGFEGGHRRRHGGISAIITSSRTQ
jgi:hypothetical protein